MNIMTTQVAFVFPGQGSQAVGMGVDICAASAAARHVFATVDETLGFSLSTLCFHGPEETLRATINAQPAITTVSLAFLAAFQEALSPQNFSWASPLTPAYTAGHSVGECTTLVAAGAMDLKGAAQLVRERGRLMHEEETLCPGGMTALLGMDMETAQEICTEATRQAQAELPSANPTHPGQGQVVIANYNAPGQIVISGEQRALTLAMDLAKARGAKRVMPLAVSGAFHSPAMQPAATKLARLIESASIDNAAIPIISNITAVPLTDVYALREELAQQVASSVQWVKTIEYLAGAGVTTFIEIGPGQALTGLIKRIAKGVTMINIGSVAEVEQAAAQVRDMGLLG